MTFADSPFVFHIIGSADDHNTLQYTESGEEPWKFVQKSHTVLSDLLLSVMTKNKTLNLLISLFLGFRLNQRIICRC
jgi:hypothetical protein